VRCVTQNRTCWESGTGISVDVGLNPGFGSRDWWHLVGFLSGGDRHQGVGRDEPPSARYLSMICQICTDLCVFLAKVV
jgi:hypothetical protein